MLEETGAREELVSELEGYGIVQPEKREGRIVYDETDREIVRAANELSRVGVGARNLRVFRSSADREAQPARSAARDRRCAPATRSAARRPWRASRASRRPSATSSTCCWSATCAASPATEAAPVPRVTRRRTVEAAVPEVWKLVSDPYALPRWWPRVSRVEDVEPAPAVAAASGPRCSRPPRARRAGRLSAASRRPSRNATSGSSSWRTRRSPEHIKDSRVEIELHGAGEGRRGW